MFNSDVSNKSAFNFLKFFVHFHWFAEQIKSLSQDCSNIYHAYFVNFLLKISFASMILCYCDSIACKDHWERFTYALHLCFLINQDI